MMDDSTIIQRLMGWPLPQWVTLGAGQLMPADGKAIEDVLSLHLGATGAAIWTLIRRDMDGCQTGYAEYTLEHASRWGIGDGAAKLLGGDGQR